MPFPQIDAPEHRVFLRPVPALCESAAKARVWRHDDQKALCGIIVRPWTDVRARAPIPWGIACILARILARIMRVCRIRQTRVLRAAAR